MSEINREICNYIYKNWIESYKSQRSFGLDHGIEESIVRRIKNTALNINETNYNMSVNTLQKICDARDLKLSDFFNLIENK